MIFYIIPLFFIDLFLIFAAFKGFIMSKLENSKFYGLIAMLSIGLFAFITCEVLLDILQYYYPIHAFEILSVNPIYALIVSALTMICVYKDGTKCVEGYLLKFEKQD